MRRILYDKLSEREVNSFCRPRFRISAVFKLQSCHSAVWEAGPHAGLTDKSLLTSLLFDIFYLPEKFQPLSSFFFLCSPFFSLLPSHEHPQTHTRTHIHSPPFDVSPSPPVHLPGKMEPQTKETGANSVIWIKWQEEEGSRGKEEWWVSGREHGRRGRQRGVGWWREAWGARCEFFLTGWSLLWADPLPAGSNVSWKCEGVRQYWMQQYQWSIARMQDF